jgi:PKD repeat protein
VTAVVAWLGGCCQPPAGADFTWSPLNPQVGQAVAFIGSVTGTLPISYAWDFGDGTTSSGATVSHTYATAGTHTPVMVAANCAAPPAVVSYTLTVGPWACQVFLPTITRAD